MIKRLFAMPERGWIILPVVISILLAIIFAVVKLGALGVFGPFVRDMMYPVLSFAMCLVFVALVMLLFIAFWSIVRTRSLIPMIILLVGVILAVLVMFSIPARQSLERQHFAQYRADYKTVVEMAQRGDLSHGDCSSSLWQLPDNYAHLAHDGCISALENVDYGFVVVFKPFSEFYGLGYGHMLYYDVMHAIDDDWYEWTYTPGSATGLE